MRKLVLFGALLATTLIVIAFSCTPQVPQTTAAKTVTALFDPSATPPVVPTPTDLVFNPRSGTLNIPIDTNASDAEKEFLSYLNSLDGYPSDTPAHVSLSGALDPSTVNSPNVRVMDIGANFALETSAAITYAPTPSSQITIAPPSPRADGSYGWRLGHTYAIALIGGANGLKGSGGEPVVGSSVWALARLNTSLVTCTDLSSPDCRATTDLIPSIETDPQARILDQAAKAVQLEMLRLHYKLVLDTLEMQGISRNDVALLWTFTVTVRPLVTFDPSNSIIPFPNDILINQTSHLVNLPIPDGGTPLQQQLYLGLNTLDGFSTTAPIISENGDAVAALNERKIDSSTLLASTGFLRLTGMNVGHPATAPSVKACLDFDCRSCADPSCIPSLFLDGGTPNNPQQLQFVPNVPLDERTRYGVFISTNLKDNSGRNVIPSTTFALARLSSTLLNNGKSTVSVLSDDQAQQLEPLRAGLNQFIVNLNAPPLQLNTQRIALAWTFSTQSEVSTLKDLRLAPQAIPPAVLPTTALFIEDQTTQLLPPGSMNIDKIYVGELVTPVLLTGPGGTFNPSNPAPRKIPFILVIPNGPPASYPVTLFGHGLQRARTDMLAIADSLAGGGQATIATDVMWHGERSSCVGARVALIPPVSTDDATCNDAVNQMCDAMSGRCVFRNRASSSLMACDPASPLGDKVCLDNNQGACFRDGKCEGGDYLRDPTTRIPRISGWNIINFTNFFATRDNFRQQVVDLAQLVRVIQGSGSGSLNSLLASQPPPVKTLNGASINYAGQSLGGILGTLFTSVATDLHRVVLNVPGGDPVNILSTSPAFADQKRLFIGTLGSQGINQGTPAYDFFIGVAKWILDPADPQNMSFSLRNGPGMPRDRAAFVQYINGDLVVPNPTTVELIAAANRAALTTTTVPVDTFVFNPNTSDLPPASRHGFLLNFVHIPTTAKAQCQVTGYVNSGIIPSSPPCPP